MTCKISKTAGSQTTWYIIYTPSLFSSTMQNSKRCMLISLHPLIQTLARPMSFNLHKCTLVSVQNKTAEHSTSKTQHWPTYSCMLFYSQLHGAHHFQLNFMCVPPIPQCHACLKRYCTLLYCLPLFINSNELLIV